MIQLGEIRQKRFPHLSLTCVKSGLQVLPHSTANPECVFRMVRKIWTDHCGSLLPSTVASLLSVKLNTDEECYNSYKLFTSSLAAACHPVYCGS